MMWLGYVLIMAAAVLAFALSRLWRLRWSAQYNRAARLRIGCCGMAATVCVLLLTALAARAIPGQRAKDVLFLCLILPVGASWLFFGNVAMFALLKLDRRERRGDHK